MLQRVFALILALYASLAAGVPTPKEHFGYVPGEDYKLADYGEISSYFQKLAAGSDRMRLVEYGKTSLGKPSYLAIISSPENLKRLGYYRELNQKLALGAVDPAEARRLAKEGRAIVWIDSGLHSTEVAPAQHSSELAYRMVTDESEEVRRIRENVILLQVPVINPDGHEMVVDWYRKNLGTPYELAPLPRLYQKYAGHDNNRDWFMMNLQETRNVSRLLFHEWFPHIVYNQHQAPAFPARIFVPPYAEPLNPNIPAAVMEGINLIGAAMKERFAREAKPGILSYFGFDAWWNGGLRSVPAFHNMHGILTETALHGYATPGTYKVSDFPERFGNGIPTKEPTVFYQRPWLGGRWGTREAIDYMLTADFAILDLAASRSDHFLYKTWEMARSNIEAGKQGQPYAYLIPAEQWDRSAAIEMLRRLQLGGIRVSRAKARFSAEGKTYEAGSWVVLAAQPFRGYLIDLLEAQKYPELRAGVTGPTKRPYDIAGWTLPLQMGIAVTRVNEPFQAALAETSEIQSEDPTLDHRQNSSFLAIAELLGRGERIRRSADGKLIRPGQPGFEEAKWELRKPRLAVYEPWVPNMDAGWTQWVLDNYKVPYTVIHNEDVRRHDLRTGFDAILLASQSSSSILHGYRDGENAGRSGKGRPAVLQRPEYTGGLGLQGAAALERFTREGGTLIALDLSAELPLSLFPIPVRNALGLADPEGSADGYYSPGSIIRITVDNKNPIAFGMPAEAYAFQTGGQSYEVTITPEYNKDAREVRTVAQYASSNLLASGWISGERAVLGKPILVEARYEQGRVVLFGFRPQFRGQSFGTFKLLLNAVFQASAKAL
jgi:hypothetical protein